MCEGGWEGYEENSERELLSPVSLSSRNPHREPSPLSLSPRPLQRWLADVAGVGPGVRVNWVPNPNLPGGSSLNPGRGGGGGGGFALIEVPSAAATGEWQRQGCKG